MPWDSNDDLWGSILDEIPNEVMNSDEGSSSNSSPLMDGSLNWGVNTPQAESLVNDYFTDQTDNTEINNIKLDYSEFYCIRTFRNRIYDICLMIIN